MSAEGKGKCACQKESVEIASLNRSRVEASENAGSGNRAD